MIIAFWSIYMEIPSSVVMSNLSDQPKRIMTWVVVSSLIDTVFHFADGGRKTALCPGGKRSGQ